MADDVVDGVEAQIPRTLTEDEDLLRKECNLPLFAETNPARGTGNVTLARRLAYRIVKTSTGLVTAVPVGVLKLYSTEPSVVRDSEPGHLPAWLSVASYPDMFSAYFAATKHRREASHDAMESAPPVPAPDSGVSTAAASSSSETVDTNGTDSRTPSPPASEGGGDIVTKRSKDDRKRARVLDGQARVSEAALRVQHMRESQARTALILGLNEQTAGGHTATTIARDYESLSTILSSWQADFCTNAVVDESIEEAQDQLESMAEQRVLLPLRLRAFRADPSKPVTAQHVLRICTAVDKAHKRRRSE